MTDARLRRGRRALTLTFLVQGAAFALLVTRIPAIQQQYGIPDAHLPAYLAAVPVLAGVGSAATGALTARIAATTLLRYAQPAVLLALAGVGLGRQTWQLAAALALFGLAVGALDAAMNMRGVRLQRAYGRSIMLGFHAAYSLGGIAGATLAWGGARLGLPLAHFHPPLALALLAGVLLIGPAHGPQRDARERPAPREGNGERAPWAGLLPLCLVMAFAYIGDATVSNWSAAYVQDILGGTEALATLPYNAYMATTLLGRAVGDRAVQRYGPAAVVRGGALLAAGGFAGVAVAPGPWTGIAAFTVLGLGLSVIVPQTFAAAGRRADADTAVARLNVFTYAGFLVGAPLVGALGAAWSPRWAMAVPLALLLVTLPYAGSVAGRADRYGGGHERPRTVDVG